MSDCISPELAFSNKYNLDHAQQYFKKHKETLARRLSHWREAQIARRALDLAGQPKVVLDIPSGAGRFWPLLCELPERTLLAADHSAAMLTVARTSQPREIAARVESFQTSAFAINLEANSVDCVFCIRLLHHIASSEHRRMILREFHRVSRDAVILSLWVDGNYKAWKRSRLETRRTAQADVSQNRFVVARSVIEEEFKQTGFNVLAALDFLPGYAMWRTYVLSKES